MREDRPTRPPRTRGAGLEAGGPAPAVPLPAGAVTAFVARTALTVEDVGSRLGLEVAQLLAFDRAGGPEWLRLALIGLAIEHGTGPSALASLVPSPAPSPAESTAPTEGPS